MLSYSAPKSKAKRLIKQCCPRETQDISKASQNGHRVIRTQITADSTHGKAFVPVNQNPNFFKVLTSVPLDFVKSDPGKGHKTTLLFSFCGDLWESLGLVCLLTRKERIEADRVPLFFSFDSLIEDSLIYLNVFLQLTELFGKNEEVWPWWRKCITRCRL